MLFTGTLGFTSTTLGIATMMPTGTNCVGSKGRFRYRFGLMMRGGGGGDSSLSPSRSALETYSAPILPAAPARFSTITGWPHLRDSFSPMMRGMTSALPPAGKGTTILTALLGYACACRAGGNPHSAAASSRAIRGLIDVLLGLAPFYRC